VVGATSPIARTVELHESTASMQGGSMKGMSMHGMETMSMHPVSKLPIPPHGSVALKPGGYHLMLLGLRRPLAAGQHFPIVVRFADGTRATATVSVENRAF
jgi:copper(I)-binding protein